MRKKKVLLSISHNDPLKKEKAYIKKAAMELGYLPTTINRIIEAADMKVITAIQREARRREIGLWTY